MNKEDVEILENLKAVINTGLVNFDGKPIYDCGYQEAIEHILSDYKRVLKENKKLKNSLIKAEKELIQNISEEKDTDISDENNIKYVDLVFENCEVARLYPNMFKYLVIENIAKNKKINCFQYKNGECWDNSSCSYFAITILPEGYNQKMDWVNQLLKERLKNNNDVTSICLTYNNGEEEDIYVPWNENNDYINEYLNTHINRYR